MKSAKISAIEMVAIASGFEVSGLCWTDTYNKIARLLQNAADYHYALHTGLVENLLAYAKQHGFAEELKQAGLRYARFAKNKKSSRCINTAVQARNIAQTENIPWEMEIPQLK